jgi:uncharacterized protein YcfL
MNKLCKIILFLLPILGCKTENKEIIYYYDQYTQDNTLYSKNSVIVKSQSVNNNEKKIIIEGQPGKYWYYEDFIQKYIANKGIYRKFDGNYVLYYRFDSIGITQSINVSIKSLFIKNSITLSDKKEYFINGKKYTVYAYSESEGSNGIISYYLDGMGFIAYDLHNGNYLLCNRMSEYNEEINNEILRKLNNSLVKDTCFFSIYRFSKKNPCLPETTLKNQND